MAGTILNYNSALLSIKFHNLWPVISFGVCSDDTRTVAVRWSITCNSRASNFAGIDRNNEVRR